MKKKAGRETHAPAETAAALPMRVGRLVKGSAPGGLKVDFPGNRAGALAARSTVPLDAAAIARAVAAGRGALLLFENGDPALPIVVGLVEESAGGALLGELLTKGKESSAKAAPAAADPVEARLDGQRVVLEGKEEVVLRCGEASITLQRDGKVIVRGAYVETRAKGINRIKGAAVKIN
jgi:hypothetical protein